MVWVMTAAVENEFYHIYLLMYLFIYSLYYSEEERKVNIWKGFPNISSDSSRSAWIDFNDYVSKT